MITFEKREDGHRIIIAFWPKEGLSMAKLEKLRTSVAKFAEVPSESIVMRYNRQKPTPPTLKDNLAAILDYFSKGRERDAIH